MCPQCSQCHQYPKPLVPLSVYLSVYLSIHVNLPIQCALVPLVPQCALVPLIPQDSNVSNYISVDENRFKKWHVDRYVYINRLIHKQRGSWIMNTQRHKRFRAIMALRHTQGTEGRQIDLHIQIDSQKHWGPRVLMASRKTRVQRAPRHTRPRSAPRELELHTYSMI